MSKALAGLAFIFFGMVSSAALAQDCNALIAHGLRNIEIQKSSSAAVATKYYRNCGMKFSDISDSVLATLEVEIFGYGSGNGGFSRAQREQRLDQWCITNREYAQSAQDQYVESQTIMAEALSAWSHCTDLAARGVHTEPRISGNQQIVDLSVSNTGAGAIQFYGVTPTNFSCDTQVPKMKAAQVKATLGSGVPIDLGPAAISVHCERKIEIKTVGGQQYKWLAAATISVRTASDPYQLFFPEETEPPLPEKLAQHIVNDFALLKRMLPPIGAIVGFVLKPEEVARLAPEWLPADGRVVNDSQSPLDKRILPDMNGRFLRGVPPNQDASDNASMTSGSLHMDQGVQLGGDTGELQHTTCSPWDHEARNFFPNQQGDVWDSVNVDEQACQHKHRLGNANLTTDLPEPPRRGVIFLVRVR
ncbi:MAG TPA: hypothetical protein VH394_04490 [Thermoanaerobaculia bacterium]|nr:hypothetical protein [Thermoanaerobaculia bacterium]